MFKILEKSLLSLFVAGGLLACQAGEDQSNIELIQDMMVGPQVKTQEGVGKNLSEPSVKVPPKGTVPRDYTPSPVKKNDLATAENLKNPLKNLSAEDVIKYEARGLEQYQIYCGVCHGMEGNGDGPISSKMLKAPPSLVQDTYVNYTDGRLYYVVTEGWGLMGSYASQITDINDRWAVVNYVRQLQRLSKGSK